MTASMILGRLQSLNILNDPKDIFLFEECLNDAKASRERHALLANISAMLIKLEGKEELAEQLGHTNKTLRTTVKNISSKPKDMPIPSIHSIQQRYDNLLLKMKQPQVVPQRPAPLKSIIKSKRSNSESIHDREPKPFKRLTFDDSRVHALRSSDSPSLIVTTPTPPSAKGSPSVEDTLYCEVSRYTPIYRSDRRNEM